MAKRQGTKKRKQTADGRNGGIVAPTSDQSGMNDRTPPNPNFWPKYFTQGTVVHEAVHNLTGKSDTQLQVLFNIPVTDKTVNITERLQKATCAK